MADITLHDLHNPDPNPKVAASADGNGSDVRSQRWDYPNDQESTFEVPDAPASGASSLRGGDTQERQVSA
jgi:hypothetical protein